jgi:hypothetical protein
VSQKSISFPRRLFPNFPFLVLWRMRIKCAEIDQISSRPKGGGSRAKALWRAPAGGFPKPRSAAAIFSTGQAGGSLDQRMPLTRALGRPRLPLARKGAYPVAAPRRRRALEHVPPG